MLGLPAVTLSILANTTSFRLSMSCGKMNGGITLPLLVITLYTMIWTEYFVLIDMNSNLSSDWHPNTGKYSYCNSECQPVEHAVSKFLEEWIATWCYFSFGQCLTDCGLLVDKMQNKLSACTKLIMQMVKIYSSHPLYIYIYIYIYIYKLKYSSFLSKKDST